MERIVTDQRVRRSDRSSFRRLDDGEGAVVLHLDSGAYHQLNKVGTLIWELLEQEPTVPELVARVRDRVDGAPADLEEDVQTFIAALAERDLVVHD